MKSMGLLLREVVKTVVRFVLLPASGRGDRTPRLTRSRGIWMARSGALGERVNGLVLSRTSRTGPGSDCRATKVNERLTRGKPRDVASGASSASASPLYRARRAIGLRPAAPEGGPRYLFARIEPPVMATAYARGVSF